jgi:hypothetical protein
MSLEVFAEGTLMADGSEQTLVEFAELGTLEGYINLSNLEAGDSITIRYYLKTKKDGVYHLYHSETYSGAQTNPTVHFVKLPTKYGCKITLEQTAGAHQTLDYIFFKETRVAAIEY